MKQRVSQRSAQICRSKNKLLVENTQEIIIFFDSDGNISECNLKAMNELGYGEEIYQIPIYEIFKKAFKFENNTLEVNAKFHNKVKETIAYRKNQTCFSAELRIAEVNEKRGYIGLCTAINISEKKDALREVKHMKTELRYFNQARNEFVANITHELRTPANGIIGLSDNLMETELEPSQSEIVKLIKRCCYNMNVIINDLLDFAKISNNKMIIEDREFSFHSLIQHIIDFNKNSISEKGLKLLVNVSNDIPDKLIGDELRLVQILNNLFSNAVKFTSVGQIALEVIKISQTEKFIELFFMIIDTGIGISIEEKDKLFQSFSQVDGSITRRFGGTGLGLAISKMLVEAMHGTIALDSEKSKGSTFSFSVQLGISPTSKEETGIRSEGSDSHIYLNEIGKTSRISRGDTPTIKELDYIRNPLKEANIMLQKDPNTKKSKEEANNNINAAIEKLTICIEMESWDRAEELSYYIKNQLSAEQGEITKNVFRLLLAVRKENHDVSLSLINELKKSMSEVM
jgi:signal transduction histidine kinase